MSGHIPGPWGAWVMGADIIITDDALARHVARVVKQGRFTDPNAKLITASPDLLAAARLAYHALLSAGEYEGRATMEGQETLVTIRDSIARATGETAEKVQTDAEYYAWRAAQTSAEGRDVVDEAGRGS